MLTVMVNAIWLENGCEINSQTVSMRKFEYRLKSKSSVYGKLYIPISFGSRKLKWGHAKMSVERSYNFVDIVQLLFF